MWNFQGSGTTSTSRGLKTMLLPARSTGAREAKWPIGVSSI